VARRKGFIAAVAQIQRDIERANRQQQRANTAAYQAQVRAAREVERLQLQRQRASAADEKEKRRLYLEARSGGVHLQNAELTSFLEELASLLHNTLEVDDHIDFESLKRPFQPAPFEAKGLDIPLKAPTYPRIEPPPSGLAKLRKGATEQYQTYLAAVDIKQREAVDDHEQLERRREEALATALRSHEVQLEAERSRIIEEHAEIERFRADFDRGDPSAVVDYFALVLQGSSYPEGFPRGSKVAYVPESRQLVVEIDLPGVEIIPTVKSYKYVKAKDEVAETARPSTDIRSRYSDLISQITLRTVHEMFEADRGRHVDSIVVNGYVDYVNRATGRPERTCLVSVRTTTGLFKEIDLAQVEPVACLKALNATVSSKPTELVPVRPVLEFSMVDPRFVEQTDVLSDMDQRVNLMDLTPTEFEGLISNLFQRMGLETRQTRPSRDGGVDCVAFDPRPIFGGKVVIQAKRYKNTVGVSAVRDLFGTVQNEGASKGILVTTSGYGGASFEFADGKPLELLSGANLLHLLVEYAGIEAKIEPPEDWKDPAFDIPDPHEAPGTKPI
jgi:restriction system protein